MNEETIFANALEKPPDARAAYLAEACGDDEALRKRLEALLAASDKVGNFMAKPAVDPAATQSLPATADRVDPTDADEEPLTFLAPSTRPDSLGRIGHYEVLQILGKGGFGIVFRAFDDTLQRMVAVKVMAPRLAATSPARKRFLREARSSAQVRHENVVQVYEVAEQPLPYLVMEFVPGETLQQRLNRVGPLDVPEVLRIGRQIAEGLAAAHATDLIHRDIKPGNVLLEGGHHKVKITDFGLARASDDASISQSGIIAGTPMYMAPEQALGQTLDQRADLFSLGSVMYQMVAGRPPFRANSTVAVLKRVADDTPRAIREIIPEAPPWLCGIIAKLHAKNPDDRYQSAREVADVLADCEAQLKANARPKDYGPISRGKPRRPRRWKWAVAAAAVLLPVIALVVLEFAGVTQLVRPQAANEPIQKAKKRSPDDEGWVQLFNGNDLTGWKKHGNAPGTWTVENGILTGSSTMGYLFSERGDYRNFSLRLEAKVNAGGDSLIAFRAPFDVTQVGPKLEFYGVPECYISYLHKCVRLRDRPTPSIARAGPQVGHPLALFTVQNDSLIQPDRWFALELIANGNRFIIKINGKEAANTTDPLNAYPKGHLALGVFSASTVVQFRRIEIKELPSVPVAKPEPPPETKPPLQVVSPDLEKWIEAVAALPAGQQVEEVRKELMRRNPGFLGTVEPKLEDGVVTEFRIVTDLVTDIAPIRVFNALRVLQCSGTYTSKTNGVLTNLTPLSGMNLADLRYLELSNTKVSDEAMVCFKDCKELSLNHLGLGNTLVSDAGLIAFKGCKALTQLFLYGTNVTDDGLANFKGCKHLRNLNLARTQVRDGGLANFKDCKSLISLELSNTRVSDAGLAHFKDCKSLTLLNLGDTRVGDAGLIPFKDCKDLTALYLYGTNVSDAGLANFKGCKQVQFLNLARTQVSDVGLVHFEDCKNLIDLHLERTQVGDAGLVAFKDCKVLSHVYLQSTNVSVEGLTNFRGSPLKDLWICNTRVTDLSPLQGMPLEEIRLTPKNITNGVDILRDMRSLKTIGISENQVWPAAEFWERYDKGEFKE